MTEEKIESNQGALKNINKGKGVQKTANKHFTSFMPAKPLQMKKYAIPKKDDGLS